MNIDSNTLINLHKEKHGFREIDSLSTSSKIG